VGYPFIASGSVWIWKVFADAGDGLVEEAGVEGPIPVALADVGAAVAWADDYCW
jgi:hypothetical protein